MYWDKLDKFQVISDITLTPIRASKRLEQEKSVLVINLDNNTSLQFTCVKHSVFKPDAKIAVHNGVNITYMNIPSNTYKAVGENHKHLRVTTHDDGSFSGFFISDEDEWIQFDSVARHTQFMKPHHLSSIGKGSHLLLWSAVKSDASKKEFPSGNTLPFSPPQPPCPSSLHKYTTTIAASVGFYNSIGRSIKQTINFMAAAIMGVNIFFEQDINLHVTIDNAIVYTSSGSVVWNSKTDEPQCNSRLVLNFRDNWPKDVPQCCGMSNGGILFHNCILNNPGVSSGAVCNVSTWY